MNQLGDKPIRNKEELEFAVFCIENVAAALGVSAEKVYDALSFFYHSETYQLLKDGVSDMHCMSDGYLAEELEREYGKSNSKH